MKAWYCIHIKPSRENDVCQLLKDIPDVETFNPRIQCRKYFRSKPRMVMEPLFPGYIFVNINAPQHAHIIRYTRGVRRIIGDHTGHPWTIDDKIIDFIRVRIENGFIDNQDDSFHTGDIVQITEGPLAGMEGIFLRQLNASERIVILLTTIENQTKVQIERNMITKKWRCQFGIII